MPEIYIIIDFVFRFRFSIYSMLLHSVPPLNRKTLLLFWKNQPRKYWCRMLTFASLTESLTRGLVLGGGGRKPPYPYTPQFCSVSRRLPRSYWRKVRVRFVLVSPLKYQDVWMSASMESWFTPEPAVGYPGSWAWERSEAAVRLVSGNIVEVNFGGDCSSSAAPADVPFGSGWARFSRQDVNLGTFFARWRRGVFSFFNFFCDGIQWETRPSSERDIRDTARGT